MTNQIKCAHFPNCALSSHSPLVFMCFSRTQMNLPLAFSRNIIRFGIFNQNLLSPWYFSKYIISGKKKCRESTMALMSTSQRIYCTISVLCIFWKPHSCKQWPSLLAEFEKTNHIKNSHKNRKQFDKFFAKVTLFSSTN